MRAVKKTWLAFAILAALTGACGDDSSGGNDGDNTGATAGGATAGETTGDSAGNDDGGGTTAGSTAGNTAGGTDAGSTTSGGKDAGGMTAAMSLPKASECGALSDGSGKALDSSAAGGCYYFYCYTTEAQLAAAATKGGACSSPVDVATQCKGTSVTVVSDCARANVAQAANAKNFGEAITKCAKPKLPGFSDGCLACNVESAVCAGKLANCLTQCSQKDSPACDKCRQDKGCTPAFYKCAGLPDPKM